MQKVMAILIVGLVSTSCGSLSTLPRSDQAIKSSLAKRNTKCAYIPYVYSGVAYDFCMLNAEWNGPYEPANGAQTGNADAAFFVAFDVVLSGLVDTLALLYTVPKQSKYGSISVQ